MTHHEACDAIERMAQPGGPLRGAAAMMPSTLRAGGFASEGYWLLSVLDVLARNHGVRVSLLAVERTAVGGYVARVDFAEDAARVGMQAEGVTRLAAVVALLVALESEVARCGG